MFNDTRCKKSSAWHRCDFENVCGYLCFKFTSLNMIGGKNVVYFFKAEVEV